jgi:hypothetical protein
MIRILTLILTLLGGPAALAIAHPISTPPLGPTPHDTSSARIVALGDGFLAVWLVRQTLAL